MSRGLPRYAARRDLGESEFREQLADAGWLTQPLSMKDWPDILAVKGGRIHLVERKSAESLKKKNKRLSEGQRAVHKLLSLFGVEVVVCDTSMEFLAKVGDIR